MKNTLFRGAGVALITPFTEDGIDFEAYGRLIDAQIAQGTDAIITAGTTGEPSTMTMQEHADVIRFAVKHTAGRVPVIAGTGANSTHEALHLACEAEQAGADGLLVVTPYYNKTTQQGLIAHFTAIADSVKTPIIVYNVPSRTGLNLLPKTMNVLADHPNIVGLKEACPDIVQVIETIALCGDRLDVYSGEDGNIIAVLAAGGAGVISVIANIAPKQTHQLCQAFFEGDLDTARRIQYQFTPLVKALFSEVNPIPVKAAAELLGFCSGHVRLPLVPMQPDTHENLKKQLEIFGLLAD